MKPCIRFSLALLVTFCISSCSIMRNSHSDTKFNPDTELNSHSDTKFNTDTELNTKYMQVSIFQTLNENEALAFDSYFHVVKIETKKDVYYDDKKITDKWVFVGTYTYITNDERQKTVPVYVRYDEYREMMINI